MRTISVRLAALACALLTCAVGGCSPDTDVVHRVPDSSVPFGLLPSGGSAVPSQLPRGPESRVYLLVDGRLRAVTRRVVGDNVPAEAIRALLAGPTEAETAKGLGSAVPPNTELLSLDVIGGIATVDLSSEFGSLGGDQQIAAIAQIVFTMTAFADVGGVRFAIDGKPIETPDGSGSLTSEPATRKAFPRLAPR